MTTSSRRTVWRKMSCLSTCVALASTGALALIAKTPALADQQPPSIGSAVRVYPVENTTMKFTGNDPISGDDRVISVANTTAGNNCDDSKGNNYSPNDCTTVQLSLSTTDAGLLNIPGLETKSDSPDGFDHIVAPSGAVITSSSNGVDPSQIFHFNGTETQLNDTLATLQFIPTTNYRESRLAASDGSLPDLNVEVINGDDGANDAVDTAIKVEGANQAPSIVVHRASLNAAVGQKAEFVGDADATDPEMCTAAICGPPYANSTPVADPDASMLLVAWLDPNCGTFNFTGAQFTSNGSASNNDIDSLLLNAQIDDNADNGYNADQRSAIENSIDPTALGLDLTQEAGDASQNTTVFAGISDLEDVDYALSNIEYTAPADPITCHLNFAISDLGNDGTPSSFNDTANPNYEVPDAKGGSGQITIEVVDPDVTVTGVSPTSGPTTGGTLVTITGTNFSGATEVTFGGSAATSFTVVSDTSITATSPAEGAGSQDIEVTAPGGTSAAVFADLFTFVAPPTVTGISPNSGPTTGGTTVTITGTGFTGATKLLFGNVAATSFTVNSSTQITAVSPAQAAGAHNIYVTTPGGTSAPVAGDMFTYAAAAKPPAPTVTGISPNSGPTTGGTTVTVTGANFNGVTNVLFGGVAATSFFATSSGTTITAVSPAQAAGAHNIYVTTPGGTSAAVTADEFTYKVAPPTITGISPTSGPTTGGTTVTITGTNLSGATKVLFGAVAATSFTVVSATSITAVSPAQAAGAHNIYVTTPSGTSAPVTADEFTYKVAPPTVTGISPTSGSTSGGTTVTITGTGFTGATKVLFGAVAATSFTVVSSTKITAVSPAQAAGAHNIYVTTPGGTSAAVTADEFTYKVAPPTITGISPTSGPTTGGTTVTITGTNLSGATKVLFGAVAATSFTVVSATSITAVSPAQAAGAHNIYVTTPSGTSAPVTADEFTYKVAPPTVTGISPTSGSTSGGTTVTITGTGFTGATKVLFGAVAATSFTVVSSTKITAVSPAQAAGAHNIYVTTPSGTSAPVAADMFTYS